jgi:hypothetical protein
MSHWRNSEVRTKANSGRGVIFDAVVHRHGSPTIGPLCNQMWQDITVATNDVQRDLARDACRNKRRWPLFFLTQDKKVVRQNRRGVRAPWPQRGSAILMAAGDR